jgi:structural maintenance of chromosome 4
MPKRPANFNTSNARKRGRPGKKKADGEGDADNEHDEDLMHQMRRRAIIDAKDDEEEWVRELEREEGGHLLEDIYIPPKITRTEHPHTGERMVIEKIVCENFKSYGGLKEMGVFHKSFSAIIGPNGNGKSNIIDAMLFVFGYRASKIRCKKVATLIHNSELLPNLKSCAVTVHFLKILDEGEKDQDD